MSAIRQITIFLIILISAGAFAAGPVSEPSQKDILSMVPGAKSFKHLSEPIDCYSLFDSEGSLAGVAVITTRVPPEIGGYRDELSVLVGVDKSGAITGTKLLAHQDSPEHMQRIISAGFFKRFLGMKPTDDWSRIETVTGATISSQAMKEDIHAASLAAADKVLKSGIFSEASKKKSAISNVIIDRPKIAGIAALFLIGFSILAVYMPGKRILRSSSLLLSFIVIGLLFNTPVSIGNFLDLGYGDIPGINNLALLSLLIFAVVSALFKGPLYCSYLCPFGAMQDAASAAKIPKCGVDDKWMKHAGRIRWLVLAAVIVAVVAFNVPAFRNVEPFSRCFAPDAGSAVWIQSGTILVAALFLRRPWCRIFCPTGLVVELLSRLGTKVRLKFRR